MVSLGQVKRIMLLVFEDDLHLEEMIENALDVARHFRADLLVAYPEIRVLDLEKTLSLVRRKHRKIPLIQICPVEGDSVKGAFREGKKYDVHLLLFHSNASEEIIRLLHGSSVPAMMIPLKTQGAGKRAA